MASRPNPYLATPELMKPMIEFGTGIAHSGLERSVIDLVNIRASQINGCAVCLHMHTKEARARGEFEERLYMLDAWRESSFYSERERAALAWTDALTRVAESHAPDEAYEAVAAQFSEEERVKLTLMIVVINGFNRIGVGFRVGHPPAAKRQAA